MRKPYYNADDKRDQRRGLVYALCLHLALFLLLLAGLLHAPKSPAPVQIELWAEGDLQVEETPDTADEDATAEAEPTSEDEASARSEERRVGKECRSRGWRGQ